MKKYYKYDEDGNYYDYFVGSTEEIKPIYKSICRSNSTNIDVHFLKIPIFRENRVYGIQIKNDNEMVVLSASDIMYELDLV